MENNPTAQSPDPNQLSNPSPVTPTPIVKNEKPAGKSPILKWILLGVLFVIGLTLIGGAYFLGANKSNNQVAQTQTISPSPTPDRTIDWQTLSENNFTFKYPKDWQTTNPSPGGPTNETIGLEQIGSDKQEGTAPPIMGTYFDNPKNLSLKDWEEQTQKTDRGLRGYYIADAKVTKSGENTYYSSNKGNCEPYYCDQVVIVSDGKIFIFQHLGLLKTDSTQDLSLYKETFETIISTFKFTDSSSSLDSTVSPTPTIFANFKQFSDSKYSFNFKYPNDWTTQVKDDPGERIINIIKNSSPSVVSLSFSISDNWDNKGYSDQAKTITIGDGISAKQDDPPKKSEQKLERYQTNYFFEKNGNVYFFACTHNWDQDYINTCNKILSSVEFSK